MCIGVVLLYPCASHALSREVGLRLGLSSGSRARAAPRGLCRHTPTSFSWGYLNAEGVCWGVVMGVLAVGRRASTDATWKEAEQMKE